MTRTTKTARALSLLLLLDTAQCSSTDIYALATGQAGSAGASAAGGSTSGHSGGGGSSGAGGGVASGGTSAMGGAASMPKEPSDAALNAAVADALSFANDRLRATVAYLEAAHPSDHATYFATDTLASGPHEGEWNIAPTNNLVINHRPQDWRSGYFPGTLWLLYRHTSAADVPPLARTWETSILSVENTPIDHDIGQRFLKSYGEELRSLQKGDDPSGEHTKTAQDTLLVAVKTLDLRFNQGGIPVGALRALDDYPPGPYPVYIDSMMNVPLYFEAWAIAGKPSTGPFKTLYDHGVTHSQTVMRDNIRSNGSSYHIVQYDDGTSGTPADGHIYAKVTDQGYGAETTWSRGQAWGMYGFTSVYGFTKDDASAQPAQFLATAEAMADYFLAHLPAVDTADTYNARAGDYVPPTDFDAALGEPVGPFNDANGDHQLGDRKPALATFTERDSSAAAVAASALYALSEIATTPEKRVSYLKNADAILRCLLTFRDVNGKLVYLAKDSPHRGLLANARTAWGRPGVSLIYGDFYLLEAIERYRNHHGP